MKNSMTSSGGRGRPIRLALLAALAALAGCASQDAYRRSVDSWRGVDINTLVETWGYPAETFAAPNGNLVYAYVSRDTYQTPKFTSYTYDPATRTGTGYSYGGETMTLYCKTFFETDAAKKVIKTSFEGNSCRAK